ncbi:hypothetical protein V500_01442, partial [Pseudogymnoascus sp. VKM F-4518 (FW-2643)]
MAPPTQPKSSNQEGRILLAIQSIKQGHIQSVRAAAMSYDVLKTTLRRRALLAMQAIKQGTCQTVQAAAVSYNVPRTTLCNRIHGITSRRDCTPNS